MHIAHTEHTKRQFFQFAIRNISSSSVGGKYSIVHRPYSSMTRVYIHSATFHKLPAMNSIRRLFFYQLSKYFCFRCTQQLTHTHTQHKCKCIGEWAIRRLRVPLLSFSRLSPSVRRVNGTSAISDICYCCCSCCFLYTTERKYSINCKLTRPGGMRNK